MLSLLPLLFFIVVYLVTSLVLNDFYKVPLSVAFLLSSVVAIATMRGKSLGERLKVFSRGASSENMMLMLWIFILAGAFASSAKQIGSIDSTVNLTLSVMPPQMILAGLFLAACFISLSIGTSVGTIVALVPLAADVASKISIADGNVLHDSALMAHLDVLFTGAVVGGAFFGDNLSFISDTTVVATQTQGCRMNEKFKANIRIVLPAALLILFIYMIIGFGMCVEGQYAEYNLLLILPYLTVLVLAVMGINVMAVLAIGCALTGVIGIVSGAYDIFGWMQSMNDGIMGMGELIVVTLLAAGMLGVIRYDGGIEQHISRMARHISSRRGAELMIAFLVIVMNICTANNTVAILTTGGIARDIAERFSIAPRRAASLLDTFSCFTQGLLPYGAQLLMAAGLAGLASTAIVPYLFYPFALGLAALLSIFMTKD